MTTKPEGPAPEPQWYDAERERTRVPATAAPSQPAREHKDCVRGKDWNALCFEISKIYAAFDEDWSDASVDDMGEFDPWHALRTIAQQTAAKESEIAGLRQSFEAEAEKRFQYFCEHRMVAAERERDSLRDALEFCRDVDTALPLDPIEKAASTIKNVRARANAALKAGKDEQQ